MSSESSDTSATIVLQQCGLCGSLGLSIKCDEPGYECAYTGNLAGVAA